MAKPSMKPRRVARNTTSHPPADAPRVTRAAGGASAPRHRSASPGPVLARRTQFRSNQPTPVRQAQQLDAGSGHNNRKVIKKTGRTGGRRARSLSSERRPLVEEDEEEEQREGEEEVHSAAATALRGGADEEELQRGRLTLSLVPEDNEDEESDKRKESRTEQQGREEPESPPLNASRYEPPPNLLPREDSISLVSEFFSTPEPDLSISQIEAEELDVGLMLEMFPHLDAHSRKILDLLVLKPPTRELRRLLLVPGSSASKRLRTYEQNFAASKTAYGTSEYISVRQVEAALGGDESFRPLLHISNLSILADVAYTSQGSGESTFGKLKKIEKDFPAQFGDVVRNANFQAALDLRTQYLVLALVNNQDTDGFDPDMWLQLIFFEGDEELDQRVVKRWPEMGEVDNWEARVLQRVMKIRTAFNPDNDDELVDVATLVDLFPWDDFVRRISGYVKARFAEIEKSRGGRRVEDLVENARNPVFEDARAKNLLDDREIPETIQEEPTPVKSTARAAQKLPGVVDLESVAAAAAMPEPVEAEESFEAYKLKHNIEQQGRAKFESASIVVNAAQMRDLKRRKTMPAPETVPVVRGTPRVATSLGSKDLDGINMTQAKFLKHLKAEKRLTPSKPAEAPTQAVPPTQPEAPQPAVAPKQAEAPSPAEAPEPMEDDGDDGDATGMSQSDGVHLSWIASLKKSRKLRNKENDKSVASMLPPAAARPMKRKRFIDPQEGATRVSQIDDGSHGMPAKRQQLQKGKEREVIAEEAEKSNSRPAFETEDQEEEEEEDDDDEDAVMYQVDSRKENGEKVKRSRKGLPDSGPARPRKIAPLKGARDSKGSRASGGTDASRKLSAAGVSDVNEYDSGDDEYDDEEEEEEGADEIEDDDEEEEENDRRRAELNARVEKIVKKDLERKAMPPRLVRKRQPWGRRQTALLIRLIGEIGCRWAEIRDMDYAEFSGRSNVQLKDKARNIKYDYLKARIQLPPNFEDVTISRTQVQTLQHMGINCDDYV